MEKKNYDKIFKTIDGTVFNNYNTLLITEKHSYLLENSSGIIGIWVMPKGENSEYELLDSYNSDNILELGSEEITRSIMAEITKKEGSNDWVDTVVLKFNDNPDGYSEDGYYTDVQIAERIYREIKDSYDEYLNEEDEDKKQTIWSDCSPVFDLTQFSFGEDGEVIALPNECDWDCLEVYLDVDDKEKVVEAIRDYLDLS